MLTDRLTRLFICCDPALAANEQVALTLSELCGLAPDEIARAFLLPTTTIEERLEAARAKLLTARSARLPPLDNLPERLAEVMAVLYLLFNEGYVATRGESLIRRTLCVEAIHLATLLRSFLREPVAELDGLLALMLLQDARRAARVDSTGELVPLAGQDRSLWNRDQLNEGRTLVASALRHGPPGPYTIQAAIAAVHADALRVEDTDWRQIEGLYRHLCALDPSPVVALNHAVAVSMADGPAAALPLVEALEGELSDYYLWHATRGDLFRRLERSSEAIASYRQAKARTKNEVERRFLEKRIIELARGN